MKKIISFLVSTVLSLVCFCGTAAVAEDESEYEMLPISSNSMTSPGIPSLYTANAVGHSGEVVCVPLYMDNGGCFSDKFDVEIKSKLPVKSIEIVNGLIREGGIVAGSTISYFAYNEEQKYIMKGHIANIYFDVPYNIENEKYSVSVTTTGTWKSYRYGPGNEVYATGQVNQSSVTTNSYIYVDGDTTEPIVLRKSTRINRDCVLNLTAYKTGKVIISIQGAYGKTPYSYSYDSVYYYDEVSHKCSSEGRVQSENDGSVVTHTMIGDNNYSDWSYTGTLQLRPEYVDSSVPISFFGEEVVIPFGENDIKKSFICGDTDGDGRVSISDSIILNRYLAGTVDTLPCSDPPPLAPEDDLG